MKTIGKLCVTVMVAAIATGCAGTGGMSDEDRIAQIVDTWQAGVEGQDIDMATKDYSDNYQDAESSSKEEYIAWLEGIMSQGFLDNAEVDDSDAEITIDGEEAQAGPFDVSSDAGGWTIDMYLEKEDGMWKIVTLDVY